MVAALAGVLLEQLKYLKAPQNFWLRPLAGADIFSITAQIWKSVDDTRKCLLPGNPARDQTGCDARSSAAKLMLKLRRSSSLSVSLASMKTFHPKVSSQLSADLRLSSGKLSAANEPQQGAPWRPRAEERRSTN